MSGPLASDLEVRPAQRRDELHTRHVLPGETVIVRNEQIDRLTLQLLTTYPDRFLSAILGGSGWQPPGSDFEKLMVALADSLEQGKGISPLVIALNPVHSRAVPAENLAAASLPPRCR